MSSAEERSKGALDRLYEFFCSIKLSLFCLIALALTSIIGTVIQQGRDPSEYVREYGASTARVIAALSLHDMYHSWWFQVLLALLLVNITLCSIRRFPHAWRLMRDSDPIFEGRSVAMHEKWERTVKGVSVEEVARKAEALLSQKAGKPVRAERDGSTYFLVSRGGWARMGVYVTHFSLFLFALGAIIGSRWGFKGFVEVPEGQTVNTILLREGGVKPLGFDVRCDKFTLAFYNDARGVPTERVRAYLSDLTVLEGGREILRKQIAVNTPLIHRDIYFYQSSYGQRAGNGAALSVMGPNRNLIVYESRIDRGGPGLDLKDGNVLELLDLTANLRETGPAVLVRVLSGAGQPVTRETVVAAARGGPTPVGNYLVALNGVDTTMYTGLLVAKDPGVPVIWAGCILISLGLLVAFFGSHRRIWLRVSQESQGVRVLLAGNSSRNRIAFENRFRELTEAAGETFGT